MKPLHRRIPYTRIAIVLILSLSVFAAYKTPYLLARRLTSCSTVEILAHRGIWDGTHTENTLRAFRNSANKNIMTIETDLRKTADDQWVFMHDRGITRTTNGEGMVGGLTVAQIKRYKTNDGVLGGVPTLDEGLTFMKNYPNTRMHIEFKSYPVKIEHVQAVLDKAKSYEVLSRIHFTSFDQQILQQVESLDPSAQVGLLSVERVSPQTAAMFDNNIYIERGKATSAYVASMHQAGIKVGAWMVDTNDEWRSTVFNGVDFQTSDNPSTLKSYCRNA